jgi:hypothetical protein
MTPPFWFMFIQAVSYLGAAGAAVIGVAKYRMDRQQARAAETEAGERKNAETAARERANEVAERDLAWRRAEAAQAFLERLEEDEMATTAMKMLDWQSREYLIDGNNYLITEEEILSALRTSGSAFDDAEVFIRDAFDSLFWHMERIQHRIDLGIVDHAHIRFPFAYLSALINKNRQIYEAFFNAYAYAGTKRLVDDLVNKFPVDLKLYEVTGGCGEEDAPRR